VQNQHIAQNPDLLTQREIALDEELAELIERISRNRDGGEYDQRPCAPRGTGLIRQGTYALDASAPTFAPDGPAFWSSSCSWLSM
jgi:hypothetical protein